VTWSATAAEQRIQVHSALFYHPERDADRLVPGSIFILRMAAQWIWQDVDVTAGGEDTYQAHRW
jgi:hypothetical protein